jgi:C-terminal processing protease CtpA/Prc
MSPKIDDAGFLESHRDWFEQKLKGARMIADQGYRLTKRPLGNQKWYVAHKKTSKREAKHKKEVHIKLTNVQKDYNNRLYRVRARIEDPQTMFLGQIKTMFETLKQPWKEDFNQQDYAMLLAVGIHNKRL